MFRILFLKWDGWVYPKRSAGARNAFHGRMESEELHGALYGVVEIGARRTRPGRTGFLVFRRRNLRFA